MFVSRSAVAAGMLLCAASVQAAVVTVSDCATAPVAKVGKRTVIDRPADDVVIQCALLPLAGTSRVEVTGRTVTVDGENGGSVASIGKGDSVELTATGVAADGSSMRLVRTNVTSANPNGSAIMTAPGGIEVLKSSLQAGDVLRLTCTGSGCPLTLDGATTGSNDLFLRAQGTVTIVSSTLATTSPIDNVEIVSATGDVRFTAQASAARSAATFVCRDDVVDLCPGPDCPLPVTIASEEAALAFCDCEKEKPTEVETGIEGNVTITADQGSLDLRNAIIHAGETIELSAANDIDLRDAGIDNCGPKSGRFNVASSSCQIDGASLLDDDPEPQPSLSCAVQGTATQLGTCSSRR